MKYPKTPGNACNLALLATGITHELDHLPFTGTVRLLAIALVLAMGSFVTTGCATDGTKTALASNDPSPTPGYYQSSEDPFHSN